MELEALLHNPVHQDKIFGDAGYVKHLLEKLLASICVMQGDFANTKHMMLNVIARNNTLDRVSHLTYKTSAFYPSCGLTPPNQTTNGDLTWGPCLEGETTMTLFAGIGYTLLSLGPALSLFLTVIVFKPFLVLTVLSSALVWLISLILIATVWRAFLPIGFSPWVFALLLLTCVSLQEAIRPVFWKMFKRVESFLNSLAERISKPRLSIIDKMQIALAAGLGHGVAHAVFFCISLLTPAFGQATFYVESCTSMPFFLVTALSSLGFVLIHTFSMVIAFDGYAEGKRMHQVFAPAMHFAASFLTLVNLMPQGCLAGVPLVLGCALVVMLYCAKIFWDKTGHPLSDPRRR